jgi:surface polysaccharide O-acyltransferase-like enzyme
VWAASGSSPSQLTLVFSSSYLGWSVALTTVSLYVLAASLMPPSEEAPHALLGALDRLGAVTLGVFATHLLVLYGLQHAGALSVRAGASTYAEVAYLAVVTVTVSFALALLLSRLPVLRRLV